MNRHSILFLIAGVLLIFLSLYLFTRPAISSVWDFSNTGQIGDTIGGITAPIINLLGALLVFISFQAQVSANRIQVKALKKEKLRNNSKNIFDKHILLYDEIKTRLHNLEFVVQYNGVPDMNGNIPQSTHIIFKGLNAVNEYILRIEDARHPQRTFYSGQIWSTYGIFLNFHFIVSAILDLIERVDINIKDENDRNYLKQNIELFYKSFISEFTERILKVYSGEGIEKLRLTKEQIDKKFSA